MPHATQASVSVRIRHEDFLGEFAQALVVPTGGGLAGARIVVENPRVWWPNGLGEQPLYEAEVEISVDGCLLDRKSERFGIRSAELIEQHNDGSPAFFFRINGQPVFVKGANWIVADAFPSRVTDEDYRRLLGLAKAAGCNMLRAWGGTIYEKQIFYDLCDEYGITVWQDFQFSLAHYPDTPSMADGVAGEARQVVKRLRNHPCIVLWCGNNECEMDTSWDAVWPGKDYFHRSVPEVVHELDPARPYWPSSPYGGDVAHSSEVGDYHGEPWFHTAKADIDFNDWRHYLLCDKGLFMSEFPTQGIPEIESLRRIIPDDQLFPPGRKMWQLHNHNNLHRNEKIGLTSQQALERMIHEMMGDPHAAEQLAYMGGVLQGDFLRWQIEYYRRHKFSIGGCLPWCFNDAWPAIGYSIIDYYRRPKPAYYFVKRAYAPLILAFDKQDDGVGAWVVNDTSQRQMGTAHLSILNLDSRPVWHPIDFDVSANATQLIWSGDRPEDFARQIVVASLEVDGRIVSRNAHFFTLMRELCWPEANVTFTRSYSECEETLTITSLSDCFVHAFRLDGLPDHAWPEDNYFDLYPGETRSVAVYGLDADQATLVAPWHPHTKVRLDGCDGLPGSLGT